MMNKKTNLTRTTGSARLARCGLAVLAAGTLFSSSCSSAGIQAVIAGIDAAAATLNQSLGDDDLSFGEWLLNELD
jgi:hypothetical protein